MEDFTKEKIRSLIPTFFIKSKTNEKEFAKQYFDVLTSKTTEPALVIRKLVFTENYYLYNDYIPKKEYKGKCLFEKYFSIKLSTLNTVINVLDNKNKNKTKKIIK